jgi:hypothetical protein
LENLFLAVFERLSDSTFGLFPFPLFLISHPAFMLDHSLAFALLDKASDFDNGLLKFFDNG